MSATYLSFDQNYIDKKNSKELYDKVTTIKQDAFRFDELSSKRQPSKKNYQVTEPEALYQRIIKQRIKVNNP